MGKFAQHWGELGHDVTVLCRQPISEGLVAPQGSKIRVVAIADPLGGLARRAAGDGAPSAGPRQIGVGGWLRAIGRMLIWPDFYGPWAARAHAWVRRQNRMDFDVVVASVSPYSSLLLGSLASRSLGTPLVIDYRDMLAFGPYYDHGRLRTWSDKRIERTVARRAALLAGVSAPMSEELTRLFARPTVTVTNGFDPADFEGYEYRADGDGLRIVYCGQLYRGRRDPTALFDAIRIARELRPDLRISVNFYGRGLSEVENLAEISGIGDLVEYHGEVTHAKSLRLQAEADLLLLLLWNNPGERAVLSGKIFEYMGARRPIVMLGLEDGAAAQLIRENQLGVVSNDPQTLSEYLIEAAETKKRDGRVAAPDGQLMRFTRQAQSLVMIESIESALRM